MEAITAYRDKLEKAIEKFPVVNGHLNEIEKKTKVKKNYIAYGVVALLTLWLMFGYGAQLLCNAIGFAYPAYCSIKAIESATKSDDVQWLMYWVVFSVFSIAEFFTDLLVGWVPFYWLSKCLFLIWCMSPLDGSSLIYNKIIYPFFVKNRATIDKVVDKGKDIANVIAKDVIEGAKTVVHDMEDKKSD